MSRVAQAWTLRSWSARRTLFVAFLAVPFLYPFVYMGFTALRTRADYLSDPIGIPRAFSLAELTSAWNSAGLGTAMLNSLLTVAVGTVVLCITCSMAAFWFMRHQGRWARVLFGGLGGLWLVPFVVYLVPFFVLMSQLKLTNSLVVLGLVYAAINAPFGLWLLGSFNRQAIPPEVLEAAEVDGASLWQLYLRVVIPMSRPALATLAAIGAISMWGDLLFAVVLIQDPTKYTLIPAAANLAGQFDAGVQQSAAAALVSVVPMFVVFLVAQRAIVRGFTAGYGK